MLDFQNVFSEPDKAFKETVINTLYQLQNNEAYMHPRRRYSKLAMIAAVTMIIFATTVTALAVSSYFGAFDRLRGIIGDDNADRLQPVEISNVVGELTTDDGIRIEIVAVGVSSNVVDFYITLEDLVDNRLDGDIRISASVFPDDFNFGGATFGADVIDRSDDGVVTLYGRQVMNQPITGRELRFTLKDISYNIMFGEHDMNYNLSILEDFTPVTYIWDTPILPTHLHDIELEVEGVENDWDNRISSIGIISGNVHIQQLSRPLSQTCTRSTNFFLVDPEVGFIMPYMGAEWPLSSLYFWIDDGGNIVSDSDGIVDFVNNYIYREDIFEVDLERLADYRLSSWFHTEDRVALNWSTTFEVDIPRDGIELVAEGLDIELECCKALLKEVIVTQSHVIINADYIETPDGLPCPSMIINTVNGPVTGKLSMFSNKPDEYSGLPIAFNVVWELVEITGFDVSDVEFLDLDSVISIEIDGHTIEFR